MDILEEVTQTNGAVSVGPARQVDRPAAHNRSARRRSPTRTPTTSQIADWIQEQLQPKGVGVVLEAEHLCMSLRGVQKFGATTVTLALQGQVRDDPRTRQEFLALTKRGEQ